MQIVPICPLVSCAHTHTPEAQIYYDPNNSMHRQQMANELNKYIPYSDEKKPVYEQVSNGLKGELLSALSVSVEKKAKHILEGTK